MKVDKTLEVYAGYLVLSELKTLPDIVLNSLVGRRVGELVSHPRLTGTVLETRTITAVHPGRTIGVSYDVGVWDTADEAIDGMMARA